MIHDEVKVTGKLRIKAYEAGVLIDSRNVDNLVVTAGKAYLVSRALGVTAPVMSAMALGTGTTSAVIGDVALQSEVGRASGANFVATTGSSSTILTYTATFLPGIATGAVTEAGIFNNTVSGGTMLSHTVFAVMNKSAVATFVIEWDIEIS
jgi:hypothetical protein